MNNEIRYFSMFTGVGGFEVGLPNSSKETQGKSDKESWEDSSLSNGESPTHRGSEPTFSCVGQSEIDKYSSQVLKYRFPNIKNWGDCTKIRPEDLPDFDMLCGGFPCQAFSIAGKRRGFEDTRGTMFFEVARILKVKRPKTIFLENVKGLLNHDKGKTFRVILQTLDELGYEVQWMVLNSKFFGVPQNRERVLIIGSLRGERRPEILPFNGNVGETNIKVAGYLNEDGWDKRNECIRRIYDTKGCGPTIPTGQGGGVMPKLSEGFKIRRLTPIECCRLQGFPDDWNEFGIDEKGVKVKMSDTQRYKQMGNAVTTKVIQAVGERISTATQPKKSEVAK